MTPSHLLKVAIAQMSPVWLDKKGTLEKIYDSIETAGKQSCELVVFGEALLPGYPFWIELTDGAKFNS
ncbi:MAG: nitrilase-related carbon-nitrogen hydrolase, partial [Reichenbachiella sp.]